MANGWNPLIGFGFTALGVGYLWEAFHKQSPMTPVGSVREDLPFATLEGRGLYGNRYLGYSSSAGQAARGAVAQGAILPVKDGVRTIKFYPAGDIDNRLKFIIDQMRKDARDPKTISEATTILSARCPTAKGGLRWCIPVKDWKSEVAMLFFALTNPNSPYALRYVRDPRDYDGFRSADLMRRIPAGDCDDMTIRLGAWLLAVGYSVKCRIVAPAGQPGAWAHIYLMVGTPPGENKEWLPLDPTEAQNGPFWEVPNRLISSKKDYEV